MPNNTMFGNTWAGIWVYDYSHNNTVIDNLELLCPNCLAATQDEDVICPECGTQFELFCPECDNLVSEDDQVCPHCAVVFEA